MDLLLKISFTAYLAMGVTFPMVYLHFLLKWW